MRFFKITGSVLTILAVSALLSVVTSSVARADSVKCNSIVTDETGTLGASDKERIESAAKRLISSGSEVRVLIISSFRIATGDLAADNFPEHMLKRIQQCDSWQTPAKNGSVKSNMLVFANAVAENRVYFNFGGSFNPYFTSSQSKDSVREAMGKKFAIGDFTAGYIAGIEQVSGIMELPNNKDQVVINNTYDTSWLGLAVVAVLFICAVFVIVGNWHKITESMKSRSKTENKRRAQRQETLFLRQSVIDLITPFDDQNQQSLRQARIDRAKHFYGSLTSEIDDHYTKMDEARRVAIAGARAIENSLSGADIQKLSIEEYRKLSDQLEDVLKKAKEASRFAVRIDNICDSVDQQIGSTNRSIGSFEQEVESMRRRVVDLQGANIDTSVIEKLIDEINLLILATKAESATIEAGTLLLGVEDLILQARLLLRETEGNLR